MAENNNNQKSGGAAKAKAKTVSKPASKKKIQLTGNDFLEYRGKKLVRVGDEIRYGKREDPYIVCFRLEDNEPLKDLTVSKHVIIELKTNEGKNSKLMRQAERDGLYHALDIGIFWLDQALEMAAGAPPTTGK